MEGKSKYEYNHNIVKKELPHNVHVNGYKISSTIGLNANVIKNA